MRSPPANTFSRWTLVVAPIAAAHVHAGPSIGYASILAAAAAGWFGVPGPGEAALIAGALLAANHRLDIWFVIAAAACGAAAGGVAGWLVGLKASRPVLIGPGPLQRLRLYLVARGERLFHRHAGLAVLLAPSWAAGIHNMRPSRFLPLNALAAVAWATVYGLLVFLIGPSVTDVVGDAGIVLPATAALIVVAAVVIRRLRRRQRGLTQTEDVA